MKGNHKGLLKMGTEYILLNNCINFAVQKKSGSEEKHAPLCCMMKYM